MRTLHKVLGGLGVVVAIVAVALIVYFTTKAQCTPSETPYGTTTPSPATRDPVVRVEQGLLEGLNKRTRGQGGVEYAAFWGIPFAQAPVGPLRFKAPRPHPGWTGVRPAKKPGPQCFQAGAPWDHLMGKSLSNAGGSEDCLFVNVFTTNLNRTEKLPVYVFVHGGGFLYGSPTDFGPDYLLPHGIVLVTFQYRLQALGFLSLDTEEIPGNCGVKDNVAALRWVNKNIAAFGGDPNRVTIGGQSAGGALAGWLSVLPEMDGLIHGATLMSGSAFHNWVYTESHVATALRVASRLAGQPVTDLTLAAQYLMNATVQEIVKHAQDVGNAVQTDPLLPWVPTPERRKPLHGGEPLLITRDAESYFLKPARTPIPQLISNTNAEWRLYYYSHNPTLDPKVDEKIVENVYDHVPRNVFPFQDTRKILNVPEVQVNYSTVYEEVKRGIRDAVTPACNLGCTVKTYIDDIWMETDAHRLAMFRAKNTKADTFLFKFSTRTELNMPAPNPNEAKDVAFHADDVAYILARPIDTNPSPKADLAIRRMATMWTNFVKYGKPITQTDELLPVDWPAISATDDLGTYLELKTDGFTLQTDSFSGPMFQFWQNLYQKYRTPSPAPAAA